MKLLKVFIEVCAYYMERHRLHVFFRKHGASFVVLHREEWKAYSRQNWASRYLEK